MNDRGLILALDPSSTRTGWAVMDRFERLVEAGVLTPEKARALSYLRIDRMCRDFLQLLAEWNPETVVIEWTSGKVGRRRHKGQGAGLAVHGAATGALWQAAESWRRSLPADEKIAAEIVLVEENRWTKGIPKPERLAGIAAVFNQYDIGQDSGGDMGDAIALALWFAHECRLRLARYATQELAMAGLCHFSGGHRCG